MVLDQKKNALITLINEQNDIEKICLHARDFSEPKYEDAEIKHLNNPNAVIECSNTMDDVCDNINDYNPARKRKKMNCFWWDDCMYYDK